MMEYIQISPASFPSPFAVDTLLITLMVFTENFNQEERSKRGTQAINGYGF